MTPDQEKEFFRKHVFTLKGRILHPALLKPMPNKEGTRVNFNVQAIFKPEDNAQEIARLGAFIKQVYDTFYPGFPIQNWVNPLKKYETYIRQDGRPNAEYLKGHYWVNAASGKDVPPQVYKQGPMGMVLLTEADQAEVYSGRNAVVNISFYRIKSQKHGLSTNINGVLLLEGGEKVQGAGSFDPNRAFGSFMQDMGMNVPVTNTPSNDPFGNSGNNSGSNGPSFI
jgi:hypothetical protein